MITRNKDHLILTGMLFVNIDTPAFEPNRPLNVCGVISVQRAAAVITSI